MRLIELIPVLDKKKPMYFNPLTIYRIEDRFSDVTIVHFTNGSYLDVKGSQKDVVSKINEALA